MTISKFKSGTLRWLSVSDVHLGHLRTSTSFILANLRRELFDGKIANLDLLIIAGDLFERLLEFNHPDKGEIMMFVDDLMTECSIYNVKLRVLEGTPSHDNKQNVIFVDLYNLGHYVNCDLKYVDTLSVEYIEEWDMRILYVPDRIRATVEEIYSDTLDIFKSLGITRVDMAVMHGAFKHQLPPMAKEVHDPEAWLRLVKHWILVGHVHFHSIRDRIAAQGSFDRLSQGEEGPKGYLMGSTNLGGDEKKDEIYFIENKHAKKYVTIDCTDLTTDESFEKIKLAIAGFPSDSFIRIRAEKGNPILSDMRTIKSLDLGNNWSSISNDDIEDVTDEDNAVVEEGLEDWIPIVIIPNNIEDIILNRLAAKQHTFETIELARSFINEYK